MYFTVLTVLSALPARRLAHRADRLADRLPAVAGGAD
jgi:hypothetical protein